MYSALVLDEESHATLRRFCGGLEDGWEVIAHHCTIAFGASFHPCEGETRIVKATHAGNNGAGNVLAVKVEGIESNNKTAHITLAVNRGAGGKPVMSNDIIKWEEIQPIYLAGTIEICK